jgi:NhaP-type Na+/H+ or K+/H+ antiporter
LTEHALVGIATIIILGVGAQWLAWRLKLPSILLLLLTGFLVGPVFGLVHPDELLGELLFPVVSLSVAIILFEGGLSLRFSELPRIGGVIFKLISIGALLTWAVGTLGAHYILGISWPIAVLLGAILIVTGPTVIGPLLRQIRPQGSTAVILKWEGILIDPVGAVLAVLVFEVIIAGEFSQAPGTLLAGVLQTVLIGTLIGLAAAGIMILLMRRYWVPDFLHNSVALLLALGAFVASNVLQPESGLLTVTVMGLALANQPWVTIRHIVEFKENLRVLLIGSLFILLAARLQIGDVLSLGWGGLVFLALLILVARPLSVWVSAWRSDLSNAEKTFMSWMAPRGIVAASVSSLFAFELVEAGYPEAQMLVSVTFLVIVGTVMLYGLTAGPLARRLGLSEADPQGVLIVGAHEFGRAVAATLQAQGIRALLLDSNEANVMAGPREGLDVRLGDVLSESTMDELDLQGIGSLLALTSNHEVNSLAALHFGELFTRAEVFQVAASARATTQEEYPTHLRGRCLFGSQYTYRWFREQLDAGAVVAAVPLTETFGVAELQARVGETAVPMFLVTARDQLLVYTADAQPIPRAGQTLICLLPPRADGTPWTGSALPAVQLAPADEGEGWGITAVVNS